MIGTRLSHYEIVAKLGEGGVVGGCFAGRRPFLGSVPPRLLPSITTDSGDGIQARCGTRGDVDRDQRGGGQQR